VNDLQTILDQNVGAGSALIEQRYGSKVSPIVRASPHPSDQTLIRYSASASGRANASGGRRAERPPRRRADPGPGSLELDGEEPVVRTRHDANRDRRPGVEAVKYRV